MKKNNRILFQGDSITDMRRSRGDNISHNLGHGYVYIIASYLSLNYHFKNYSFINRGVAQDKIEDISKRWQKDALSLKPDTLSILAGINNIGSIVNDNGTTDLIKFRDIYIELLNDFKKEMPGSSIIICEPFSLPVDKRMKNWTKRKEVLNETHDILKEISSDLDIQYIELQSVFEEASKLKPYEYWLYDGVHPSPAGHALIAKTWIKEVLNIEL
ncbi:SGNH/GDSL hydrolase family protein [Sulfurimonas gotlandica]|nr:GDSL-type esterase/lipase family protein [Sulfurimonas gotlandica]